MTEEKLDLQNGIDALERSIIAQVEQMFKQLASNIADDLVLMEIEDSQNSTYNDQLVQKLDSIFSKHYHEIVAEVKRSMVELR